MDVKEFQQKLAKVAAIAQDNGGILRKEQLREFFEGMDLSEQQLVKILQYLKAKGITIEGAETKEPQADAQEEWKQINRVPLTAAEKAYLKEYLEDLKEVYTSEKTQEEVFAAWEKGESGAKEELTRMYMPVAAEIAAEMNCQEVFLADLIQEANLCLLTALEAPEKGVGNDAWLRRKIAEGIYQVIGEQTERNFQDECLVEKVQKLETAIRELSEDEEEESSFGIGELAVLLDMKVEEIKDVLRLTGEKQ